jgi:hypothetical protein
VGFLKLRKPAVLRAQHGLSFWDIRDGAKALMQLIEKGLECLRLPDFFHFVHDIVKIMTLATSGSSASPNASDTPSTPICWPASTALP